MVSSVWLAVIDQGSNRCSGGCRQFNQPGVPANLHRNSFRTAWLLKDLRS
jgi:hypothetical protein